ncbi:D-erythronate dehydrogenase [Zwartia vadi]|uniref:D-erythronate dehydrogenase n=1 Tax=Zwartia vadi TaxID=3058168 RepID=UPI0025B35861|nr:D-erythronate dehydrogenase [Zwartia vadi]MDN3986655.1 NAD-dependent epimerase/dehydratase family protein [Zwartia vadi]
MNILITGGAGFLGSLLARELLKRERLRGQTLTRLLLTDQSACTNPEIVNHPKVQIDTGDLLERLPELLKQDYDAVFHLASAVSGECEIDFGLGLRSNLDTTRALLEGLRAQHGRTGLAPIFFFSSSVAVFGSDPAISLPSVVTDTCLPTPQSSYGIHKFICEQLVADYTRKGFIDGRVARLMTVSVRPGKPNGAASSFLSGIIREPLAGLEARCPVSLDTAVALSSPLTSIAGVLAVVEASRESFGGRTALNLPALTVTVGQMLQALREVAGDQVAERVRVEPEEQIMRIVGGWPSRFNCQRTQRLGLKADACYRDIIIQYLEMTRA